MNYLQREIKALRASMAELTERNKALRASMAELTERLDKATAPENPVVRVKDTFGHSDNMLQFEWLPSRLVRISIGGKSVLVNGGDMASLRFELDEMARATYDG